MVVKEKGNVDGQTHTKVPVPVSLTEVKPVMVEVVLGRVTTREYSMLSTFPFSLFLFLSHPNKISDRDLLFLSLHFPSPFPPLFP